MKRRRRCVAVGLVLTLALATGAGAQETDPPQTAGLPELNRGIKAYLDEERDEAAEVFEGLLADDAKADVHMACRYYLGLIALERGLSLSRDASDASRAGADEEAAARAEAARAQFSAAQRQFERIVDTADPSAETVRAALLLGIAQLASDYPLGDDLAAFELAQRAERTLRHYVNETAMGQRDRYGRFYLAVAQYRLADEYSQQPGRGLEVAEALRQAEENLDEALAIARAAAAEEQIDEPTLEAFETVVIYYRGLLAIQRRDHAAARTQFATVIQREPRGSGLAGNAEQIIEVLDEVERSTPPPVALDIPRPIGPLEFDADITIGNAYNSNLILLGERTQLPLGYAHQDDYQYGIQGNFTLSRYITKADAPILGESVSIGIGGSTTHVWQPSVAEFDINRYAGQAYVNWQPVRDLYLGLQYEYSDTQLGHAPFIVSHRLTPVLSKLWRRADGETEAGRTDVYYTFDERTYMDEISDFRLNRSGRYHALGVQQTFNLAQARDLPYMQNYFAAHEKEAELLGDEWLLLRLGYEYQSERTIGTEFDMYGHVLTCGVDVPLPYRLMFEFRGMFGWENYGEPSLFDYERKERFDFVQRYGFGLVYTLVARNEVRDFRTLQMLLRGGVEFTIQDSNTWDRLGQRVYEYDQQIYGLELQVSF